MVWKGKCSLAKGVWMHSLFLFFGVQKNVEDNFTSELWRGNKKMSGTENRLGSEEIQRCLRQKMFQYFKHTYLIFVLMQLFADYFKAKFVEIFRNRHPILVCFLQPASTFQYIQGPSPLHHSFGRGCNYMKKMVEHVSAQLYAAHQNKHVN